MYKEFITQLHIHAKAIRILTKGYLPILFITPIKLKEILDAVKTTIQKTNPDYDLVIKRLHLYYDLKLVTFGIDRGGNTTSNIHTSIHSTSTSTASDRDSTSSNSR